MNNLKNSDKLFGLWSKIVSKVNYSELDEVIKIIGKRVIDVNQVFVNIIYYVQSIILFGNILGFMDGI